MATLLGNISLLEWIGYLASVIIAVSMAFNSIVKFRITNLVGAALFSAYGFIIGAIPVGILNAFIVAVDVYYLLMIFGKKDRFELIEIQADSGYLHRFIDYYRKDILQFFPDFNFKLPAGNAQYMILRNMAVAGIFIAQHEERKMQIVLDYVTPDYRDFKSGKFLAEQLFPIFIQQGIEVLEASTTSKKHAAYLLRMGFQSTGNGDFEKPLRKQAAS